jgi:hypothetical protein
VVRRQRLLGDRVCRHRRVGLVAHVVVSGDLASLCLQAVDPLPRRRHRGVEVGAAGELLDQVPYVDDELRVERVDELEGVCRPIRLPPPGLELDLVDVQHVVCVPD